MSFEPSASQRFQSIARETISAVIDAPIKSLPARRWAVDQLASRLRYLMEHDAAQLGLSEAEAAKAIEAAAADVLEARERLENGQ